jgi:hypothetical protein
MNWIDIENLSCKHLNTQSLNPYSNVGKARGDVVVKVLRYKPAGRGFDSLGNWNFSVT